MKIYKLQRGDKFSVPQAPNIPVLTFDHMDGMYCYATTDDGQVCNIAGWIECQKESTDVPSVEAPPLQPPEEEPRQVLG